MHKSEAIRILDGRRVAVIGASSGIGAATARLLAESGARLVLTSRDRSRNALEKVAAVCREYDVDAELLSFDVTDDSRLKECVEQAWAVFDGCDAWLHFAGADTLTGADARLSFAEKLELLWRVDVEGTIRTCREVGRRMREVGRGVILTMGWDQAETGMEGDSGQLFAAAKGAVMAFTKSLALDLAPAVRVNCIAPGWIRTKWGEGASASWQARAIREAPLARWGTPEDVARVTRFLVSEDSAFLTGQILRVGGGAVRQ
jgi:3-oxoacyl-[acyl-carrier protein] reductase